MTALGDRLARAVLRGITRLPDGLVRRLAGQPVQLDGQRLDPLVQLLLRLSQHSKSRHGDTAAQRAEADNIGNWLAPREIHDVSTHDMTLPGSAGPCPVRHYRPKSGGRGALLFLHGGGYVVGSLTSHDGVCRALADRAEMSVFALDYRLAPEHPFPAAASDAVAAFRGLVAQAQELGLDPSRIAVGGDSSGGGLAAHVAQACRDDQHPPRLQVLWVPWLDLAEKRGSYRLFGRGFFLETTQLDWYRDQYAPEPEDRRDPRCSPLYGSVVGVAPALILTAAFDPLRDEGEAYADRLRAAGVHVTLHRVPGAPHTMLSVAGYIPAAAPALSEAATALRQAMA